MKYCNTPSYEECDNSIIIILNWVQFYTYEVRKYKDILFITYLFIFYYFLLQFIAVQR